VTPVTPVTLTPPPSAGLWAPACGLEGCPHAGWPSHPSSLPACVHAGEAGYFRVDVDYDCGITSDDAAVAYVKALA